MEILCGPPGPARWILEREKGIGRDYGGRGENRTIRARFSAEVAAVASSVCRVNPAKYLLRLLRERTRAGGSASARARAMGMSARLALTVSPR